ncbi:MAG: valine--tRNA ligase [Desulfobulbaceae bacterium]|jgi:valyl-tRNA synthetase|nr:valine--tRNA ligase [Desulfobulbaceae bacterium]
MTETFLSKSYEFAATEEKWLARWRAEHCFAAHMDAGKPAFSIVIPPPNVTGVLHIGHALNNTLQDVLTRYHRMKGDNTLWLPGTDHAGIATQNVVEKQLLAEGKRRNDLGRDAFIERVWQWRREKGGVIIEQLKKIGASCDWERERFTMDEGLSKAVRQVFVTLYKEGLIYKGDYIVNRCPSCQTALSDDEVEYEEGDGSLYHIRYPLADGSGALVVATTRPETMLGDTAVAVHPDDARYQDFIGKEVVLPLTGRTIRVIADKAVELGFGTGALKVTPSHDRNDYEMGKRHNLAFIKIMDGRGLMNENAGVYQGLERFACRERIVADLRDAGFLVSIEDYRHSVGVCYRCHTVIEPETSVQWFVAMKTLAEEAMAAVEDGRVRLHPKSWRQNFFGWMNNIRDWCISRQIWWGHRIPSWDCQDCGERIVEMTDPSRCPQCGSTNIVQEKDVLDTWFSSALWPFSTMGWPEKTSELAMFYPTSVLVTSFDILFFWVARMMMMGLHFMGEPPFKDVYLHALVRDKDGRKMSKSLGNGIDPLDVVAQHGADAMRFTLTALAAQGREIRLDLERIEGYRHFINKIWNAARFAHMHLADCHENIREIADNTEQLSLAQRWILSRAEACAETVRRAYDDFLFNEAAQASYQFIWTEFCDWYLEWIKPDLFSADIGVKDEARGVLLAVLETLLRLTHPIIPFVTEEIWSVLPGARSSLMLSPFPEPRPDWRDLRAEEEMAVVMEVISGLRTIRSEYEIHPSVKLTAVVFCPGQEKQAVLSANGERIAALTRFERLSITASGAKPENAAGFVGADLEIFVPLQGFVDVAAELAKNQKELAKVEEKLAQTRKKLGNENFLKKAQPAAVAKEQGKLAELQGRLALLTEAGNRLKKMAGAA